MQSLNSCKWGREHRGLFYILFPAWVEFKAKALHCSGGSLPLMHWQKLLLTRTFLSCIVCLWKIRGSDKKKKKKKEEREKGRGRHWPQCKPGTLPLPDHWPCWKTPLAAGSPACHPHVSQAGGAAGLLQPRGPVFYTFLRLHAPSECASTLTADMRLQLLLCIVFFLLASLLPAGGQRPGKRCFCVTPSAGGSSCLPGAPPACFWSRIQHAVSALRDEFVAARLPLPRVLRRAFAAWIRALRLYL